MAEGKWIDGLTADTDAEDAAQKVFSVRWNVVREYLPLAAERAYDDVEFVHQLRVGTRRCAAALKVFRPLLPKHDYKTARNLLRTVRQAAGAARDWDVFLGNLDASPAMKTATSQTAGVFLSGFAMGERAAAQASLLTVMQANRDEVDDWQEALPDAVRAAKDDRIETFGDLAEKYLDALFRTFTTEIAAHPTRPEALHQLRITGKRVRYAMEIFAGCYAAPFRDRLYPAVAKVQDYLGTVQDSHVAESRLLGISARLHASRPELAQQVEPGITEFLEESRQAARDAEDGFRAWETEWAQLMIAHPLSELLTEVRRKP